MPDNRKIAATAMELARNAVMAERQDEHGSAEDSFQMIADLWNVYMRHQFVRAGVPNPQYSITGLDVAEMMSLLKLARRKYGNLYQIDHYADDIGYVSLAAMLAISSQKAAEVLPCQALSPGGKDCPMPHLCSDTRTCHQTQKA